MPELQPTMPFEPPAGPPPAADTVAEGRTTPNGEDPNRTLGYAVSPEASFPTIPGFIIDKELGRGGMGVVYRAKQIGLDRTVALKMILRADFAGAEQKLRFQIEAENAARVQHPNIVQVYEIGEHQGQPFVALEYIEGGSLADGLNRYRFTPTEAALLVETLARAIHAAHVQGIIHRDLKPANILLASPGRESGESVPKITDFGLAKRLDTTNELTGSGAIMGTPSYMAPEQARGDTKHVGPAADQYALGIIFYQLLSHRLPFVGTHAADLFDKIANEEAVPPRSRNPQVPADLSIICLKCLEKDPAKRYTTAEALAEDLKNWRDHRPIVARPATRLERTVKWCRRYPAVAGLVAVSLVAACVASGLAWWAMEERNAKDTALQQKIAALEAESKALASERRRLTQIENGVEMFAGMLTGLNPRAAEQGGDPLYVQLRRRAETAAAELDEDNIGDPVAVARLRTTLGETLLGLGSFPTAVQVLEKARATQERELGGEHPETIRTLNCLGAAYKATGQFPEAIKILEALVVRQEARLGPEHTDTITVLNNLVTTHQAAGDLSQVVKTLTRLHQVMVNKRGADDPATLTLQANLAAAHQAAGQLPVAIQLYEQVREARLRSQGMTHPDTLVAFNNLAMAYLDAGRQLEAVKLLEAARDVQIKEIGADHPDALMTLSNLGVAYAQTDRPAEAIKLLEQTREAQLKRLGLEHPHTLLVLSNLAAAYALERHPDTIKTLEQVRDLQLKKLGPNHPDTLGTQRSLATAYLHAGRKLEALRLYKQVADTQTATLGAEHDATLTTLDYLGEAYRVTNQLPKALQLLTQVRDARLKLLGAGHPETLTTMNSLAMTYEDAGRLAEAISLLEQVREGRTKALGPEHRDTLATLNSLGMAYHEAGRVRDAIQLLEHARGCFERKRGREHPSTLTLMNNLARAYVDDQRLADAIRLFEQVVDAQTRVLGPDDLTTMVTKNNLATTYAEAGKIAEAIRLVEQVRDAFLTKLGNDHPTTLATRNNLASLYDRAGRLTEAIQQHELLQSACVKTFGPNHPNTLLSMANLASAYRRTGRLPEALPLLERAAQGMEKLGFAHQYAGRIVPIAIGAYEAAGQCDRAEAWQRKWLAHIQKKTGSQSTASAGELAVLGTLLLKQKKWAEAEATLHECTLLRERLQPDEWTTFFALSMLGEALLQQKKVADAEPLLLKGYEGVKARAKEGKNSTVQKIMAQRLAEAGERLHGLYEASGRKEEARRLRKELDELQVTAVLRPPAR